MSDVASDSRELERSEPPGDPVATFRHIISTDDLQPLKGFYALLDSFRDDPDSANIAMSHEAAIEPLVAATIRKPRTPEQRKCLQGFFKTYLDSVATMVFDVTQERLDDMGTTGRADVPELRTYAGYICLLYATGVVPDALLAE